MSGRSILVTGFEPYAGRGSNPAFEVMKALDGRMIGGMKVAGGSLPVSVPGMRKKLFALLDEVRPSAVICLGLWPGEPMIRLERVGINMADFEIPDNDGVMLKETPVAQNPAAAQWATLPLEPIKSALLKAGIPARLSATAGTYLCNACLYSLMEGLAARGTSIPAGFIHVPYMPEQVASLLDDLYTGEVMELHQRADVASMELSRTIRAVEIAIETIAA